MFDISDEVLIMVNELFRVSGLSPSDAYLRIIIDEVKKCGDTWIFMNLGLDEEVDKKNCTIFSIKGFRWAIYNEDLRFISGKKINANDMISWNRVI